jgi:hypothetical protein
MAAGARDLWPADFAIVTATPPSEILQQQASNLTRRTKGILAGKVTRRSEFGQSFLSFWIVAPGLDNYQYELLEIHHGVDLYPVVVDAALGVAVRTSGDPTKIVIQPTLAQWAGQTPVSLDSEEKFVEWLEKVLASDQTRKVIGSLLRQSGVSVGTQ